TGLNNFMAPEEATGKPTGYPDQTGQRFLRALNIQTGEIAWEIPQPGARARQNLVRRSGHRGWSDLLWPAKRRLCCRGSAKRQNLVAIPDQRSNESLAHDFYRGRQPIRGGGRRPEYPLLRSVSR